MKLCPQCEFIYEDDQSVCDMDGKALVYDRGPLASEEIVTSGSPTLEESAAIPVSPTAGFPASQPSRWQSRSSAFVALAAIIVAVLLFVVYYARTRQPRSVNANQPSNQSSIQSSDQSTQAATAAHEPAPESVSAPPASLAPDQVSPASPNGTTSSPSSLSISPTESLSRGRMAVSPVSAGGSSGDSRAPVIVWLTNGASIKADEAWERREGVWYRQGGVVTFLKRSRVRAIQRPGAPNPRSKSVAIKAQEKNRKPENAIARNQPRADKSEAVSMKKESRVTSFLKRTGQILKKPFKL